MGPKRLKVLLLSLAIFAVGSCDQIGRALVKSGHTYRNDAGIVVKYTGHSKNFTDTIRQVKFPGAKKLTVKHGLRVEGVARSSDKIQIMGGYHSQNGVTLNKTDTALIISPADTILQTDQFIRNIKVVVPINRIRQLTADKFSTIQLMDTAVKPYFKINAYAHSLVKGSLRVDSMEANVKDHGELKIKGTVKGFNLRAIEHSDVTINRLTHVKSASVAVKDFSELTIQGKARMMNAKITRHSTLNGRQLEAQKADLKVINHSETTLYVNDKLWSTCNDHSDISVEGNPEVMERKTSRFSHVKIK